MNMKCYKMSCRYEDVKYEMLAVEAPRFRKGSGAKEDSSPASSLIIL